MHWHTSKQCMVALTNAETPVTLICGTWLMWFCSSPHFMSLWCEVHAKSERVAHSCKTVTRCARNHMHVWNFSTVALQNSAHGLSHSSDELATVLPTNMLKPKRCFGCSHVGSWDVMQHVQKTSLVPSRFVKPVIIVVIGRLSRGSLSVYGREVKSWQDSGFDSGSSWTQLSQIPREMTSPIFGE